MEVELSSVNRRQFDVRLSIPRALSPLESEVYALVHRSVSRGYVTGSIRLEISGAMREQSISVDAKMAEAYASRLRLLAARLDLVDDLSLTSLIALPGVVECASHNEDSAKIWPSLRKALKAALAELTAMKSAEGQALGRDLERRCERLKRLLTRIERRAPAVPGRYRKVLRERLAKAGVDLSAAGQALLREIALFADRSDITEEVVRLWSHFQQAQKKLARGRSVGRVMDFLCQEMFREINTVGSKANDTSISKLVIQFKSELESIREQVQNIE